MIARALCGDGIVRWHQPGGMVARALEPRALRPVQPFGAPVNIEHGDLAIGHIVHMAVDTTGALDLVAVLHEPPPSECTHVSLEARHDDGADIEVQAGLSPPAPPPSGCSRTRSCWGLDVRERASGLPHGLSDWVASLLQQAHRQHRRRLPHLEVQFPQSVQRHHDDITEHRQLNDAARWSGQRVPGRVVRDPDGPSARCRQGNTCSPRAGTHHRLRGRVRPAATNTGTRSGAAARCAGHAIVWPWSSTACSP